MSLTKEQILAANDSQLLRVDVPEWPDAEGKPGVVCIRVMSVGERDAYENQWARAKETGLDDFRSRFLVRCLVDEAGQRLFDNGDISKLASKSARVVDRLWKAAMKHNSLSDESVEEEAKN